MLDNKDINIYNDDNNFNMNIKINIEIWPSSTYLKSQGYFTSFNYSHKFISKN